ncbi:MAG TPA: lysophospholipid acyltransferase family protein [Terriglobales bacterium]|nr:lysophospholipid acyltransferase family protein [Terriglobales bacterium]
MRQAVAILRTALVLLFLVLYLPLAALAAFPWTFLTGSVEFLYACGMFGARAAVRLAGIRVKREGLEHIDPKATYIYMCNHVSNIDPPVVVPALPRRTSVLVKKELFKIPILGRAMRLGSLVPVDRSNRDAAIQSLRAAGDVMRAGINMTVFPEGTRSREGKLLPFKKGPFYLAMETGVPVVPMTILNSFELMPKGQSYALPGMVRVLFHEPLDPAKFSDKDQLMAAVRSAIAAPLPEQRR